MNSLQTHSPHTHTHTHTHICTHTHNTITYRNAGCICKCKPVRVHVHTDTHTHTFLVMFAGKTIDYLDNCDRDAYVHSSHQCVPSPTKCYDATAWASEPVRQVRRPPDQYKYCYDELTEKGMTPFRMHLIISCYVCHCASTNEVLTCNDNVHVYQCWGSSDNLKEKWMPLARY